MGVGCSKGRQKTAEEVVNEKFSSNPVTDASLSTFNLGRAQDVVALVAKTKQQLKLERILVIDPRGSLTIFLEPFGSVPAEFQPLDKISAVLSHRWGDVREVNSKPFPAGFLQATYSETTWVDAISHMNDPELVGNTLASMGGIYATKPCRALYFEHDLQTAWNGIIRGWMWQELVPGPQNHRYGTPEVESLHLLYRNRLLTSILARYFDADNADPTCMWEDDGSSCPRHWPSWHAYRMRNLEAVLEATGKAPEDSAALEAMEQLFSALGAVTTVPIKTTRSRHAHGRPDRDYDVNTGAFMALCDVCEAIMQYDAEFEMGEDQRAVLCASLPILRRGQLSLSRRVLVDNAISHLSCRNYAVASDCVAASFSVILSQVQQPVAQSSCRDLLDSALEGYLGRFEYAVDGMQLGVNDPFGVVEASEEARRRVRGITHVAQRLEMHNSSLHRREQALRVTFLSAHDGERYVGEAKMLDEGASSEAKGQIFKSYRAALASLKWLEEAERETELLAREAAFLGGGG